MRNGKTQIDDIESRLSVVEADIAVLKNSDSWIIEGIKRIEKNQSKTDDALKDMSNVLTDNLTAIRADIASGYVSKESMGWLETVKKSAIGIIVAALIGAAAAFIAKEGMK